MEGGSEIGRVRDREEGRGRGGRREGEGREREREREGGGGRGYDMFNKFVQKRMRSTTTFVSCFGGGGGVGMGAGVNGWEREILFYSFLSRFCSDKTKHLKKVKFTHQYVKSSLHKTTTDKTTAHRQSNWHSHMESCALFFCFVLFLF